MALAIAGLLPSLCASIDVQVDSGQATISEVISGTLGINKLGTGTAILSAANTYTGLTTVVGGELLVTGSVLGDVTVNAGTRLGGSGNGTTTGKIGGNVVNNGIVRTNDTTGSHLSIVGTYTQAGTATFLAKVSPLACDYLAVAGAATLDAGAILNVFVQPGVYPTGGVTHTILMAGTLNGDFADPVNFSPTGGTLPDVDLAILKDGNVYRLTVSGIEHTYDNTHTVNAEDIASLSAPVTLTNANIATDATVSVPVTIETGGSFEVGDAATVTFNEAVVLPAASTFNVEGDVKFTNDVVADADSEMTLTGGGKATFDVDSDGSVMQGGIVVGPNTEIVVNNDLAAKSLTLDATATLSGIGTIQHDVTGGKGRPGGSIGTLNFDRNYSPDALTIQFRPDVDTMGGDASKVIVGETINLANKPLTLIPVPTSGIEIYPRTFLAGPHEYTIVTADKIVGEFATLEAPTIADWSYALDYTDDYKSLLVTLTVGADTTLESEVRLDGAGEDFTYDIIAAPYLRRLPTTAHTLVQKPSSRASSKTAHSKAGGSTKKAAKKSRKGGGGVRRG